MISWGINALNHGSSIAIFDNENFISNSVYTTDIPSMFSENRPDRIYWYEQPWLKKLRQLYAGQYSTAFDMSVIPNTVVKEWNLSNIPITYTPHHASHAAAGYYTSPFNHCAVVVLDAIGEFECASIWEGKEGNLRKVWSRNYPNSLGLFYSAFTKLIGFQPIKEEHLLQELSLAGDPNKFYNDVKCYIDDTLQARINLHKGVRDWKFPVTTLQDRRDIAAAVQRVFEEQVELIMKIAQKLTGSKSLVYMGGCAMNSKANRKIINNWDYSWSLPNPGDPSSSIGAVLFHTKHRIHNSKFGPVKHIDIKI
jgi:carbamoyltransferase